MQPVAESEWKVLYFNFTNNRDMTPVTATAGQRFVECLYLLLMNGADVNIKASGGSTAIFLAVVKFWS